ncbi:DUF1345 domain-containing protein [Spirosoma aureum]|uniref:DUF1345 domain-containing protein n=1 Tax=Spirosoma aureum TaxID=2692134 RepID=A0A6G9AUX9_9BACT|nr:DUF1345 domain-containing protein [Spirosoma aureum]QIP16188.1 DUF1345 domain-containing protein [Spirosoma aureum]
MLSSLLLKITRFDLSHRLIIASIAALFAYFWMTDVVSGAACTTIIWVVFALTMLFLMWLTIFNAHPRELPQLSRLEDSSRVMILIFVLVAAIASLFAVIVLLDSISDDNRSQSIILAILAVASSWTLVHTLFTIRYAHLFYGNDPNQKKRPGGLEFPSDPEPDYLDFAYFAFIIGMTSQVSDVAISSKRIRRVALAHGVLSFLFNTIIIALTVGGLSGKL